MLNKELIAVAGEEATPHVILTVGREWVLGGNSYGWGSASIGSISRVPVWGDARLTTLKSTIRNSSNTTMFSASGQGSPGDISIKRLDTGYKINLSYNEDIASSIASGSLFTKTDEGKTVPLVFDPPPTSYL